MPIKIKLIAKTIIASTTNFLRKTKLGDFVFEQVLNSAMDSKQSITHGNSHFVFVAPNQLNRFRIDTFSTKEPETLEWIDTFPCGSVLLDIGANVGLYSCYAAKERNCNVFAFEPSVFNLELLARNIFINDLTGKVAIVPLPLSDALGFSTLNMTNTEWGGAHCQHSVKTTAGMVRK